MPKEKTRMRDLIILLPGIMGSVLKKDGKYLWALSVYAASRALLTLGSGLDLLKIAGDDHLEDDIGDGIIATDLIKMPRLIPDFFKIGGYAKISKMITDSFDVVKASADETVNDNIPANFFEFPYDWRRDNRVTAKRLEKLIERRLTQWREYCSPNAKVILLAHSMGGLVARYYLEVLGGWDKCKALITFGTPHRGSLKALSYLAGPQKNFFVDLKGMARTFTSVYQLLPAYKAVMSKGAYHYVADLEIAGIDPERAKAAKGFHQEIREHVEANRKDSRYLSDGYVNIPVVGTYQPTLQSAKLSETGLSVDNSLPAGADDLLWHGDGTVPYISAVPVEMSKSHRNIFFAECHGTLPNNEYVLDFIHDQLADMQIEGMENFLGAANKPDRRRAISMALNDLYFVGEPFSVTAHLLEDGNSIEDAGVSQSYIGAIMSIITPLGQQGQRITQALIPEGNEWRLVLEGMMPGEYQIELHTTKKGEGTPTPVSDYFMVAPQTA